MGDFEIRPPQPEEYPAAGAVTVEAYDVDGHLAGDVGYDKELRDVARGAHRLYERLGFTRLAERDWRPFPRITLIASEIDL